jgi:hypothetical protein
MSGNGRAVVPFQAGRVLRVAGAPGPPTSPVQLSPPIWLSVYIRFLSAGVVFSDSSLCEGDPQWKCLVIGLIQPMLNTPRWIRPGDTCAYVSFGALFSD